MLGPARLDNHVFILNFLPQPLNPASFFLLLCVLCRGHHHILENSKARRLLLEDWEVKLALRTLLPQHRLLLGEIVLLVLGVAAHGANTHQPRPDELKVGDYVLHDGAVGRPRLAVLVVGVLVPVVQGPAAGPETALIVPVPVIRMLPPGEMQEAGQRHEMTTRVSEEDFEFLVCIWAREAHPLHTQVDRHDDGVTRSRGES